MLVLLADSDHRMLAGRHHLLPDGPVAGDVARVHARIVGALQATLFPVAFVILARTVRPGRDTAQLEQLARCTVPGWNNHVQSE